MSTPHDDGTGEKASLLLVDDQPANLTSLRAVLDRPDYDIVLARSGEEALSHVLRHTFAVILLDVAMPTMDGFEVARIIKQRPASRATPIVFVTASLQHIEWIFKAYSVGAVDFLQKPLDPYQVRAKVSVFVDLFRQSRQIQRQAERLREQERREQALEVERLRFSHERRFRNLAEAIPHIVWVAGQSGEIEYVTRRWSEVTGRPEQQAKEHGWLSAVYADDAEGLRRRWTQAFTKEAPFDFEFRLRVRDGSYRWYHGRALPERDATGKVIRWLGTLTDIDERHRVSDALQEAVQMRDEFLSVASHELRTPLTALMLRIDKLRRGGADDEGLRGGLDTAKQQVARLDALVGRLLDVSRLATGRVVLARDTFDLGETVRDVALRMQEESARAGCSVELDLQPGVVGAWDRLRLEQVVTNLLSNALKYGAGKRVQLRVEGETGRARLTVSDGGIGISEESLERIFGRFERAAPSSRYGGLGLGLYVVAQIVEAHGGRVQAVSRPGCGATFIVELPTTATASEASEPGESPGESPATRGAASSEGAPGSPDSREPPSAVRSQAS
jgi:PAS domain S-box-containing protein